MINWRIFLFCIAGTNGLKQKHQVLDLPSVLTKGLNYVAVKFAGHYTDKPAGYTLYTILVGIDDPIALLVLSSLACAKGLK